MEDEDNGGKQKIIVDQENYTLIEQIMEIKFHPSQLETLVSILQNPSLNQRLKSVIGLRVVISFHQDQALSQKVIDLGCIPILLGYMQAKDSPQIQLEATWILTNIACGSTAQCESIIQKNGLEVFF